MHTFLMINFHTHLYLSVRMESSANCPVVREGGTCSMPKFESTWGVSGFSLHANQCCYYYNGENILINILI